MFNKIKQVLLALFALAIITVVAPSQSALAQCTLNVNPSSGEVGDTVAITASGLYLGQNTTYRIYFSDQEVDLSGTGDKYVEYELTRYSYFQVTKTIIDNSFTQQVDVPINYYTGGPVDKDGTYYFYIAKQFSSPGGDGGQKYVILQKAPFEITGFTKATLTPTQGSVGQEIEIEGEGFWPGEYIQILFDGIDITENYVYGQPKAASSGVEAGTFNVVVPAPETDYGEKEVNIIGKTSGFTDNKKFTILPEVSLSQADGEAGSQVEVSGTGFGNNVVIYFDSQVKAQVRTSNGSFNHSITVPGDAAIGSYLVEVKDSLKPTTINASASFEVKIYLDPSIELTPQGGTVGSVIDIEGEEFNNNEDIILTIDDDEIDHEDIETSSSGTFIGSFVIPELPAGTHTLKASDGIVSTTQTFTVTHEATLSKTSGKAGDAVTVSGTGFKANTALTVTFAGTQVTLDGVSPKTGANGSFSYIFNVPVIAEGAHNVVITVGTTSVTKTFTTDMDMTITPATGKVGTEVDITASGFAPNSSAIIYFGNNVIGTKNTDAEGNLTYTFTVPAVSQGTYPVKAEVSGISATKDFALSAEVNIADDSGNVGDQVSITGTGFGSSKPLTLTWGGDNIGGTGLTTTAEGTFNIAFDVPAVKGGSYTVSISDGTITKTQTFTVAQSTPPVPQPVSPALYSKQKGDVTFDWNPVSYDIMAVTYQMQVARDAAFTNITIDKTGLTADQYTLAEAEKLEKAGKDNPYFWRVRAVDEAGNASDWTGPAEFYYGSGWPAWLTWVLIGLGVVVLGILAFWVGRRIAYYSY